MSSASSSSLILADYAQAATLINAAARILILTHVQPDGDAFGSMLGLGHVLGAAGKQVTFAADGGAPSSFAFLPGSDLIRDQIEGVQVDLVIVTDCGDERRAGELGQKARLLAVPWINLDHHRTNTAFADANVMDPAFVSSSECVLTLLDYLGLPLTKDSAQCLLCGMVTDTMCFRIDAVTAATFGIAQRLMAAGADLTVVVQNTVARMSTAALRLWGQVMPTVQIEGKVAWARITLEARKSVGYTETSDGGLVSVLLQADDAFIACVFREKDKQSVDVRLRAVPGFDVATIAAELGGGGHMLASGVTMQGTIDDVEAIVLPLLRKAASQGTPRYIVKP
jgi:phosphoesterase RecJ-like protein